MSMLSAKLLTQEKKQRELVVSALPTHRDHEGEENRGTSPYHVALDILTEDKTLADPYDLSLAPFQGCPPCLCGLASQWQDGRTIEEDTQTGMSSCPLSHILDMPSIIKRPTLKSVTLLNACTCYALCLRHIPTISSSQAPKSKQKIIPENSIFRQPTSRLSILSFFESTDNWRKFP